MATTTPPHKRKVTFTRTLTDLGTNDPEIIRKAVELLSYSPEPMTFFHTRGENGPALFVSQRAYTYLETVLRTRREFQEPVTVVVTR